LDWCGAVIVNARNSSYTILNRYNISLKWKETTTEIVLL